MLHKAEEWKMIGHAPKIKMMKERGRHLRLDDELCRMRIENLDWHNRVIFVPDSKTAEGRRLFH
jgi:hypothetical protein